MKSLLYTIFLLHISIITTLAQRGDCKAIRNTKAIKLYNKAFVIPLHRHKEAIKLLNQALKIKNNYVDAHFRKGEIFYKQANKYLNEDKDSLKTNEYLTKAEQSFLKVIEICPSFNYYDAFYYLGELCYTRKDYLNSKKFIETFIEHNQETSDKCEPANRILEHLNKYFDLLNNPVPFNPVPLEFVCTNDDEYLPLMSPDEEILIFSRRKLEKYGKTNEGLFISNRDWSDSSIYRFSPGTPMNSPFNDGRDQGAATITIDNNHIFITICEYRRTRHTSVKNCDIFTSDNENGKWSPLRRMSDKVNGNNSFEGMPSITADGKVLFFASARKGGYGGIDIYKSEKLANGKWSEAQNLGPVINTKDDDKTPFIHSDSQTLYFSSNGRFGMGGFDIFVSTLKDDVWQKPKNIGYPINTPNDDVYYVPSVDGRRAYYSSFANNSLGEYDIFRIDLAETHVRNQTVIAGVAKDDDGQLLKDPIVTIFNIDDDIIGVYTPEEKTKKFLIILPRGNKYKVLFESGNSGDIEKVIKVPTASYDQTGNVVNFDDIVISSKTYKMPVDENALAQQKAQRIADSLKNIAAANSEGNDENDDNEMSFKDKILSFFGKDSDDDNNEDTENNDENRDLANNDSSDENNNDLNDENKSDKLNSDSDKNTENYDNDKYLADNKKSRSNGKGFLGFITSTAGKFSIFGILCALILFFIFRVRNK